MEPFVDKNIPAKDCTIAEILELAESLTKNHPTDGPKIKSIRKEFNGRVTFNTIRHLDEVLSTIKQYWTRVPGFRW